MTRKTVKGVLKTWKEDRGFGFIKPNDGGKDIFLHISALDSRSRRPIADDIIYYQVARDHRGKYKAINAYIEGVELTTSNPENTATPVKKLGWIALITSLLIIAAAVAWYYTQQPV